MERSRFGNRRYSRLGNLRYEGCFVGQGNLFSLILFFGFPQTDAFVAGVGVLETGQRARNHLQDFEALLRVFHFVEFIDGFGQFHDQEVAEVAGDVGAVGGGSFLIDRATLFEEFVPLGAAGEGVGPIGVAAASPIGEVVFGEGASMEFFGEDALDFGQGV